MTADLSSGWIFRCGVIRSPELQPIMFLSGFRDLVKPQWVAIVEELKIAGAQPVSELSKRLEMSYMAAKKHCEDLLALGYLERRRAPRTEVGRPEIFYRLNGKAAALFPQAGAGLTLEILDAVRTMFGDTAPDRLLFQYFQQQAERWKLKLAKAKSLVEKATLLADLREKEGCFARCKYDADRGFRIEEYHHPLLPVFDRHPHAIGMELRMLEQLLGSKITRREIAGGPQGPARVDFEIATLGVR
jgi:predicted ArsR family transcriptional regulator